MSPALKINSPSVQSSSHDGIPPPKMVLFSADKVELSWKKAMRAGAGLANLGNTCFLNSALQCLTYTAPLANYLIHLDHQKHCRVNGQFCMLCAMQQQLYYIHSNSGQAIKPMYILKNLRMIAKHLQFGRQEDAHEFIRYSVDAMQKACLFGYSSKIDVHIRATTAVHQIFGGYLRSRVRCMQCKSVSDTYDPFLDLSLDINKQGCVNLQRCLETFVRVEVLQGDNAYKCMQCKNTVQAYKKFSIHRPPNVLTLQLKRFSNFMGNKINKDLTYPSKLNIEPYMSNKLDGGYWYELYAVLVHSGFSCQSGHYYAYAKAPNGQWYCFNDSRVHQVGANQVLSQQAYLLFYSRNPKESVQFGNLKQSLNKNLHSSPANSNSKVHPCHGSIITNGNGNAGAHEMMQRPRIGPQLPANFKREKESSFQSTSSDKETGTSVNKQCNQPKVNASLFAPGPSCSVNSNRKPLQFSLNRKPKLANITSSTPKLTNGGQNHSSMTKSSSFAVQNGNQKSLKVETKSSTLTGTNSSGLRSPVLDRFLKDSSEPGTSASMFLSASSISNGGLGGLKPLVSYSSEDSDDDDDNDHDSPLQADYTSLTSTLKKLRGEISLPANKQKLPLTTPRKENRSSVVEKVKNANKSGLKTTGSKTPSQSAEIIFHKHDDDDRKNNDKTPPNGCATKPELVKSDTKGVFDIVNSVSGPARTNISCLPQGGAAVNLQREMSSQREPILHLLNNEIENVFTGQESRGKFEVKNTKDNDVLDLAEKILGTKNEDKKENVKQNGHSIENECSKLGDRISDHQNGSKERKHRHPDESTSFASPQKENKSQSQHHIHKPQKRSPSPTRHVSDRKSETPTKKQKKYKSDRRHYSDSYDSDDSYHGRREKHHKSRKEGRESPLRRRFCSKTNGKSSEDGSSKAERLYCDKQEFEQSLRRKAKKVKKQRLKERRTLQRSIDKESPKYESRQSLSRDRQRGSDTNGIKEAHEHSHDSSKSHGAKRHHEHAGNHHHDKKAKKEKNYENGKVHKKDGKRDSDDRKSVTKDRPNILQQLLKQFSGKAYGAKVTTWNGEESLVEKDAQRTWSELHAPLTDEWDRE